CSSSSEPRGRSAKRFWKAPAWIPRTSPPSAGDHPRSVAPSEPERERRRSSGVGSRHRLSPRVRYPRGAGLRRRECAYAARRPRASRSLRARPRPELRLPSPERRRKVRIEIHERIDLLEEERVPEIESFLLSLHALVESILGRKLEGTKVEVSARPAHADLYRRYFSGTVSFGAEVSALVVPESWLDHPSPFAD